MRIGEWLSKPFTRVDLYAGVAVLVVASIVMIVAGTFWVIAR